MSAGERARGKLLDAWEAPVGAGEPVGVVTSTFNFDPEFFESELLARFLCFENAPSASSVYTTERDFRLGDVLATVLVDRRYATRTNTLSWDVLPVIVPNECCQHAKVTLLAWSRCVRLIVASANLTEAAYRTNLEVFAAFDFVEQAEVPRSLLGEFVSLLDRMLAYVPQPPEQPPDGPITRARGLLRDIRSVAGTLTLPTEWPGDIQVHPVVLEPGDSPGVLDRMAALWGNGTRPDTIRICSPYWAAPMAAGRDPLVTALLDRMAPRGERRIEVQVPGEIEQGDSWVAYAPEAIQLTGKRLPRLEVDVLPVPSAQAQEHRYLHAKLLRWQRHGGDGGDLLLVGSSNATGPGLGLRPTPGADLPTFPRNIEAGVCFVSDRSRRTAHWFDTCSQTLRKRGR